MIFPMRYCLRMTVILCRLLLLIVFLSTSAKAQDDSAPESSKNYRKMISTIYYIPFYNLDRQYSCSGEESKFTLRTKDKKPIAPLCYSHIKNCMMQGSCAVIKNQKRLLLNYRSFIAKEPIFSILEQTECPYGRGPRNVCLEPYYTIAADLNFHKLGDVIYVPDLKGITLPNGEIHDGFFMVRDTGGKIKGRDRFDFYTGFTPHLDPYNPFSNARLQDKKTAMPYLKVVSSSLKDKIKMKRNYPMLASEF